jgi:hypothetical protein
MALKGQKTSEETKAKMRAAHRARIDANPELYRQACNYIHIGAKRSQTTRDKMSEAHKGHKPSQETIAKISWAVRNSRKEVSNA